MLHDTDNALNIMCYCYIVYLNCDKVAEPVCYRVKQSETVPLTVTVLSRGPPQSPHLSVITGVV